MGLICISVITNDVEDLFICLYALYVFFGEVSVQIFCLFWNFLVVQWLRFHGSSAGDTGSIPGWELRFHILYNVARKKKRIF